jgi:hypothetical protein
LNVDCTTKGGSVKETKKHRLRTRPRRINQIHHQYPSTHPEKSTKAITEALATLQEDKKTQL